jgi:hypothetical protein
MMPVVLYPTPTNLSPSAEEARAPQAEAGEGCEVQSAAELVEVYIEPSLARATILLPSAEHATHDHTFGGADVGVQGCAPAGGVSGRNSAARMVGTRVFTPDYLSA